MWRQSWAPPSSSRCFPIWKNYGAAGARDAPPNDHLFGCNDQAVRQPKAPGEAMRIVVLGASGFIGSAAAAWLAYHALVNIGPSPPASLKARDARQKEPWSCDTPPTGSIRA